MVPRICRSLPQRQEAEPLAFDSALRADTRAPDRLTGGFRAHVFCLAAQLFHEGVQELLAVTERARALRQRAGRDASLLPPVCSCKTTRACVSRTCRTRQRPRETRRRRGPDASATLTACGTCTHFRRCVHPTARTTHSRMRRVSTTHVGRARHPTRRGGECQLHAGAPLRLARCPAHARAPSAGSTGRPFRRAGSTTAASSSPWT
jgi:hypothetical protein